LRSRLPRCHERLCRGPPAIPQHAQKAGGITVGEPRSLTRWIVDAIHSELLLDHGGAAGVRAGGDDLLESALARPKNRLAYEPDSELGAPAAASLFGLVKNHGYVDGNKRVGFAAAATFLLLNGSRLNASETDTYAAQI